MTMQELLDKRQDFIQGVQNAVSEDLLKNGLELESVSLTRIDQTAMQFFDPNNAFDAEGLTRLTEQTQKRRRERNEIEQDTTVAISQKNFEAKQLQLEIDRQKRFAELAQVQEVASREAEQAPIGRQGAGREGARGRSRRRSSPSARSAKPRSPSSRQCGSARSKPTRGRRSRPSSSSAPRRSPSRNKAISIAQKSEEQSQAQASANLALAEAVKSEQAVKTAEEVATAEREKQVALVLATPGSRDARPSA